MNNEQRVVHRGPGNGLIDQAGQPVTPPENWVFLLAGDAGLTRRVTARTGFWRVRAPMGRRMISLGIWAPAAIIAEARAELEAIRASEGYHKKLAGERRRRAERQSAYEEAFYQAVRAFLAFAPRYEPLERAMASAVSRHAVPVGSGTVARTTRIPLEERAARAVIAWMRHRTTAYETMDVARVKGERRQVRRMLARRSLELLRSYREGREIDPGCPLRQALKTEQAAEEPAA